MATVNEINVIDNLEKRLVDLGYTQNKLHDQVFAYLGDLGLNQPTLVERLNMYGGWYKLIKGELPPAYLPQVERLFEAFDVQPSDKQKRVLNNFYKDGLAGIMHKMDGVYIMHSHDSQASLVNWKNANEVATPVNSPTFTPFGGWEGDGVSSRILIPTPFKNFVMASSSVVSSQTTAPSGGGGNVGVRYGDSSSSAGNSRLYYSPNNSSNQSTTRLFTTSILHVPNLTTTLTSIVREQGTITTRHDDEVKYTDSTEGSGQVTAPIKLLNVATSYGSMELNIFMFGGAINAQEVSTLSSAWSTFLTDFVAD